MKTLLVVAATCVMATLMSELTITGTNSKDRLPFPIQKPSGVTMLMKYLQVSRMLIRANILNMHSVQHKRHYSR